MQGAAAIVLVCGSLTLCAPTGRPWPQNKAARTLLLGEKLAPELQKKVLRGGDEFLINFLRTIPEESYGRLARMMGEIK